MATDGTSGLRGKVQRRPAALVGVIQRGPSRDQRGDGVAVAATGGEGQRRQATPHPGGEVRAPIAEGRHDPHEARLGGQVQRRHLGLPRANTHATLGLSRTSNGRDERRRAMTMTRTSRLGSHMTRP